MSHVKLELSYDMNNAEDRQAFANLAGMLAGSAKMTVVEEPSTEAPVKKEPKQVKEKKAPKEVEPVEKEDPEKAEVEEDNTKPKFTKDDLRSKVGLLAADHRAAIKDELDRLKVKNVTSLPDAEIDAFMEFLNGLEDE